jgi:hypothetical protein
MIIFLDIDGVLVPAKSWKSPELLSDGFPDFSRSAVHVLQQITTEDVTIMLTTSHRFRFSIEEWERIFQERGVQVQNLDRIKVFTRGASRKDEIEHWFSVNPCDDNFIILDDDLSLNGLPSFLKEKLVLTCSMIGLKEEHLEKITKILGRQLQAG